MKIKIAFLSFFLLIFLGINLAYGSFFEENTGIKQTAEKSGHLSGIFSSPDKIDFGVSLIIEIVLTFVGVLFMILLIYGGILWMTSAGNEQQAEKAKNIITQSVVGLLVVLLAYAFTFFIIGRFIS